MIVVFLLYNISAVRAFFNLKFEFKIDKLERGCYCLYTLSTEKRRILFEKETKQLGQTDMLILSVLEEGDILMLLL